MSAWLIIAGLVPVWAAGVYCWRTARRNPKPANGPLPTDHDLRRRLLAGVFDRLNSPNQNLNCEPNQHHSQRPR